MICSIRKNGFPASGVSTRTNRSAPLVVAPSHTPSPLSVAQTRGSTLGALHKLPEFNVSDGGWDIEERLDFIVSIEFRTPVLPTISRVNRP
jgi:hypothetical protein